jgi:hypothetical protein
MYPERAKRVQLFVTKEYCILDVQQQMNNEKSFFLTQAIYKLLQLQCNTVNIINPATLFQVI